MNTEPIPVHLWQFDVEQAVFLLGRRHDELAANFNPYIVSDEMIAKCTSIQRHVNACWLRGPDGLLNRKNPLTGSGLRHAH